MSQADTPQASPLHMSVHSVPTPDDGASQRTRMGRLKMLLVWAICAAPVVASYLTYYVIKPQSRANYGTLILPPKPMPADSQIRLSDAKGAAVKLSSLKGQWLLVTVAGGACDHRCENLLYLQRQLREMLGKDKDRMDRVWFVSDQAEVPKALEGGLQGAWVLRAPVADLQRWLAPEHGQALEAHLYLVDPRGDWMMRFPAQADPTRVKKDLARLMKANESWDEAGR